jgi:hypothetical protein
VMKCRHGEGEWQPTRAKTAISTGGGSMLRNGIHLHVGQWAGNAADHPHQLSKGKHERKRRRQREPSLYQKTMAVVAVTTRTQTGDRGKDAEQEVDRVDRVFRLHVF